MVRYSGNRLIIGSFTEVCHYRLGSLLAHNLRKLLDARLAHGTYGFKVAQQLREALVANARDMAQLAIDKLLVALLAVKRDAKAVRLISNMANHL